MAESEQIWWIYVKIENVAEISSAWIDFRIEFIEKQNFYTILSWIGSEMPSTHIWGH